MEQKHKKLQSIIEGYGSALLAFSGGVDSALLACVAAEVLGNERLLCVMAASSTYSERERRDARALADELGLRYRVIESEETDIPGFSENPPQRCYFCKKELFTKLGALAQEEGLQVVMEGSNHDDVKDFRPGRRAVDELGVVSPLLEAGLSKADVRTLSTRLGLRTARKPACACLASRFPYGERITVEKLRRVEEAEERIRALGFSQLRVRSHGNLARVELDASEMDKGWHLREALHAACHKAGFVFCALDTAGFRSGAMNEALSPKEIGNA